MLHQLDEIITAHTYTTESHPLKTPRHCSSSQLTFLKQNEEHQKSYFIIHSKNKACQYRKLAGKWLLLYVSTEKTRHDILHGVTNRITLSIRTQSQILLHLTQIIDPAAKPPQTAIHHIDMQGIL